MGRYYKVYTRPNTWELEKIVNEQLEKGGELVGGVVVTNETFTPYEIGSARRDRVNVEYSQAMLIVKDE